MRSSRARSLSQDTRKQPLEILLEGRVGNGRCCRFEMHHQVMTREFASPRIAAKYLADLSFQTMPNNRITDLPARGDAQAGIR